MFRARGHLESLAIKWMLLQHNLFFSGLCFKLLHHLSLISEWEPKKVNKAHAAFLQKSVMYLAAGDNTVCIYMRSLTCPQTPKSTLIFLAYTWKNILKLGFRLASRNTELMVRLLASSDRPRSAKIIVRSQILYQSIAQPHWVHASPRNNHMQISYKPKTSCLAWYMY